MICDLQITIDMKKEYVKAMIDTGNLLKDPITKMPVVIVEREILYKIIPKEILDNIENILGNVAAGAHSCSIDEYISRIRLIPFSSLGKENGMLVGIKVDSVSINYESKEICVNNVIVGVYNNRLTKNGKYHALIGLKILEYEGGREDDKYFRDVKI